MKLLMALVLLCADYLQRKNVKQQGANGLTYGKQASGLPVHWVKALADSHGLDAIPVPEQPALKSGLTHCLAIVKVKSGRESRGALTFWSEEELYLGTYCLGYGSLRSSLSGVGDIAAMQDACSVTVEKAVSLAPPLEVDCPLRFRFDFWGPSSVTWDAFERCISSSSLATAAAALAVNEKDLTDFLQSPCGLRVPALPLQLLLRGAWRHLLLDGRMFIQRFNHRSRAEAWQKQLNFPSQDWLQMLKLRARHERGSSGADLRREPLRFDAEHAHSLSAFLREQADHILKGIDTPEKQAECQFFLEDQVMRLRTVEKVAEQRWQVAQGYVREKMRPDRLLHGLLAAMNLRDRSKLPETLRHGLESAGVRDVSGNAVQQLAKLAPDSSQIQRSQFRIDAALCRYYAEEVFARAPADFLYLWADSSPQAGTDWLLSIVRTVPQEHVFACIRAGRRLEASVAEFEEAILQGASSAMCNIAQERHELGIFLQKNIHTHRQIPMAQGSGDASLDKKMVCLLRKTFVEAGSLDKTRKIFQSVRGVCADLGTEAGIADVEGIKLADLVPSWMTDAGSGLMSEDDLLQMLEEEGDEKSFVLPQALPLPGLLHIFHNMSSRMHSILPQFDSWLVKLKAVAALLHHPHLRKRLIATCVLDTPWSWLQFKLQNGVAKPALWRWGTVSAIIPKILDVKHLLQQVWNPQKFSMAANQAQEEAEAEDHPLPRANEHEDPDFKLETVTDAVRSEKWWLYTAMLGKLGQFSEDLSRWAEGCACHGWLYTKHSSRRNTGRDGAEELSACDHLEAIRKSLHLPVAAGDGPRFKCPLAGQRAVQLASGELWVLLDDLERNYIQDILNDNACSEVQVTEVLDDFALGKSSIVEQLKVKLACWQSLPWALAALNMADQVRAREVAIEAMQRYDASPQDCSLHHRLTRKIFAPGPQGREDLERFAAGSPLAELETLRDFIWGLRFLPTVERIQEGDHAIVKSLAALRTTKVTGPFISCKLRFSEIHDLVSSASSFQKLLFYFEEMEDADQLALKFGFWNHPLWVEARQQRYSRRIKRQLAALIVYALDPATQYAKVRKVAEKRDRRKKEKDKLIRAALKTFLPQGRSALKPENVERVAVSHHLQERLAMQCFYSFSQDALQFSALCAFPDFENKPRGPPAISDKMSEEFAHGMRLESEQESVDMLLGDAVLQSAGVEPCNFGKAQQLRDGIAGLPGLAKAGSESEQIVFIRVVSTNPSRRRTVPLPAAEAAKLDPADMCVSLHAAHVMSLEDCSEPSCSRAALCVSVEPQSAQGIASHVQVLSLFAQQSHDLMALKQSMRAWTQQPTLLFGIRGCGALSPAAHTLLGKFVLARAFPTCSDDACLCVQDGDERLGTAAEELQRMGVASRRWTKASDRSSGWSLTSWGTESLVHMREVARPQAVFRDSGVLTALVEDEHHSMTSWELLQVLSHEGWTMKRKDQKLKPLDLPPVQRGSRREWFFSTLHLRSKKTLAYMRTLALSSALFEQGKLAILYHCQPEKYYNSILDGSSNGEIALPLDGAEHQSGEAAAAAAAIEDRMSEAPELSLDVAPSAPICADPLVRLGFANAGTLESPGNKCDLEDDAESLQGCGPCGSETGAYWLRSPPSSVSYEPESPPHQADVEVVEVASVEASDDAVAADDADGEVPGAEEREQQDAGLVLAGLNPASASASKARSASSRVIESHPDSFLWGGTFRMTWTPPEKRPPHGQWQVRCPWHRLSDSTACTKARQAGPTEETKDLALRILQTWALRAPLHTLKRNHASDTVRAEDVLPAEVLASRVAALPRPPSMPPTDAEQDAAAADKFRTSAKAAAKGKPKATTESIVRPRKKAKAKPKSKQKVKKNKQQEASGDVSDAASAMSLAAASSPRGSLSAAGSASSRCQSSSESGSGSSSSSSSSSSD